MSLTGNLEDLPLLDIIQIVSFSKKTGCLGIHDDERVAGIVFREGLVVSAYTWDTPALDARADLLPPATRDELLRTRIEIALEQLIRLREGQFDFSLTDVPPDWVEGRALARETLTQGINAQEMLLNLARGIDEDRRDSRAALEASFASPDAAAAYEVEPETDSALEPPGEAGVAAEDPELAVTAPVRPLSPSDIAALAQDEAHPQAASPAAFDRNLAAAADSGDAPTAPVIRLEALSGGPLPAAPGGAPALPRRILLVDDEADVRQTLALHFAEAGYNVEEAETPEEALKLAARLAKVGADFVLVTDLNMPASGGASFQGGFEVIKRLWKMGLHPPVVMMTDGLAGAVRARARQMGIEHLVFKPGLSRLDPALFERDLSGFATQLVGEVLPNLKGGARPRVTPPGARPQAPSEAPPDELSRQFRLLQQRLEDLRRSGDAARIAVLVMKVAREFFERALLLLVKNDEVRGLGGFGPAPRGTHLNLLAREISIPLSEPSMFLDVVSERRTWCGVPPEGRWNSYVLRRIGRFQSNLVALIPLLTHRQTTAVLLGDNPETGRPFARLEALEVFVDQAGVTLENVFLQRKIMALQAAASDKMRS